MDDSSAVSSTSRSEVAAATARTEETMAPQQVPVNVHEAGDALVVVAPMPAVFPDDVRVELEGSRLRFYAHVRSAGPREYLRHEWDYGGFEREIDLPEGYGSAVEATLANGQLVIRVLRGGPTTAETQPVAPGQGRQREH